MAVQIKRDRKGRTPRQRQIIFRKRIKIGLTLALCMGMVAGVAATGYNLYQRQREKALAEAMAAFQDLPTDIPVVTKEQLEKPAMAHFTNGVGILVKEATADEIMKYDQDEEQVVELGEIEEPEEEAVAEEAEEVYVVIDLSEQKLWLCQGEVIILESDVVTGTANTSRATPPGEFTISQKARYATLMNNAKSDYWMRFNGGIGLHDASWRHGKFGGDIYLTDGSHGCVNLPLDVAATLYDWVEVGTPVIVNE